MLGVPGLYVDQITALIADADTPGVVITQSGGTTRLVEGATSVLDGLSDSYTVRLTRDPGTETITITLAPLATPSLDGANATGTAA